MRISDWSSDVCSSDLAGLEDLQRGEVRIGGRTVPGARVNIPTERRHVGMVFQDHALFPHLSVAAHIAFGLSHLPAAGPRDRAALWAGRLGPGGHRAAYLTPQLGRAPCRVRAGQTV